VFLPHAARPAALRRRFRAGLINEGSREARTVNGEHLHRVAVIEDERHFDLLVFLYEPRDAHEADAERAVWAGLGAIDAVGHLDVKFVRLQARVGIATGLVVVGDLIGEGSAQERASRAPVGSLTDPTSFCFQFGFIHTTQTIYSPPVRRAGHVVRSH